MLSNRDHSVLLLGRCVAACLGIAVAALDGVAEAQVIVYETLRPIMPAYVANYAPTGNYAAVTAFSPPVYSAPVPIAATVPASSVAVTSYYAPAASAAVPVTAFYAPAAAVATTAYYAPAAPVVAAPVTVAYAPAAVAVPLYRRGLFGGLRPVRTAWYYPY